MLAQTRSHRGTKRRGSRDLSLGEVESFHPGRSRREEHEKKAAQAMAVKFDVTVLAKTPPTLEEIAQMISRGDIADAARGINAVAKTSAGDLTEDICRSFVYAAIPAAKGCRGARTLRGSDRNAVKVAITNTVRRLGGLLNPTAKRDLADFLHKEGWSGTVDAHLKGISGNA